ncbi:putative phosphoinositide 3kinase family, accessory domain [Monocercomonoides exilis]|uniref:putative phosphoinositide 3kinase family, accessory domain n=1 Tax=Monocercomonoides exilis TaxID=2049356 RepID=UPI00355A8F44|nr:putative phosphoinositide 3kinase family, accessory domain [Monocercomonoides exilis]|eukprot:MONOS_863.1-p1 / transcript=MONOS_863.1 / gene=MONOS_863 / organism=Monocercomonoides_exilis_PA203 / gene_product=phosphoinositide 3kinase family, accessory domain / transcript_product=phosphoinositide 3kinase family, accessory domain / location=Mono_scaffold00014:122042-134051(+) / protein_length=3600 / sequence_SO=supercontig / SO=protein_coding / is_pseudo=false
MAFTEPPWVITENIDDIDPLDLLPTVIMHFRFDFDDHAQITFPCSCKQTISQLRDMLFHKADLSGISFPHARRMYFFRFRETRILLPNTDLDIESSSDMPFYDVEEWLLAALNGSPLEVEILHESHCLEYLNEISTEKTGLVSLNEEHFLPSEPEQNQELDEQCEIDLKPITRPIPDLSTLSKRPDQDVFVRQSIAQLSKDGFYVGLDMLPLEKDFSKDHLTYLEQMAEEINSITGPLNLKNTPEIQHFRESMARQRKEMEMPIARLDPERLKRGFDCELEEQKIIHTPTCLTMLPEKLPLKFMVSVLLPDKITTKAMHMTRHYTARDAVQQLLSVKNTAAQITELPLDLNKLTMKVKEEGDYYLPYELIISKACVRAALLSTPPRPVVLALVALSEANEAVCATPADQTIHVLDRHIPPAPPRLPNESVAKARAREEEERSPASLPFISVWDADAALSVTLIGIDGINSRWSSNLAMLCGEERDKKGKVKTPANIPVDCTDCLLYVSASLCFGGQTLHPFKMLSPLAWASPNVHFNATLKTKLKLAQIPSEARICFTLYAQKAVRSESYSLSVSSSSAGAGSSSSSVYATATVGSSASSAQTVSGSSSSSQLQFVPRAGDIAVPSDKDIELGWVSCPVFDFRGFLHSHSLALPLWPDAAANPIGTCNGNMGDPNAPALVVAFPSFPAPVVFPKELNAEEEKCFLVAEAAAIHQKKTAQSQRSSTISAIQSMYGTPPLTSSASSSSLMPFSPHTHNASVSASSPSSSSSSNSPYSPVISSPARTSRPLRAASPPPNFVSSPFGLATSQSRVFRPTLIKNIPLPKRAPPPPPPSSRIDDSILANFSPAQSSSSSPSSSTSASSASSSSNASSSTTTTAPSTTSSDSSANFASSSQESQTPPLPLDADNIQSNCHTSQSPLSSSSSSPTGIQPPVINTTHPLYPRYRPPPAAFASLPQAPPSSVHYLIDVGLREYIKFPTASEWQTILAVIKQNPLEAIEPAHRSLLFLHRFHLIGIAPALPKFLQSVPWNHRKSVIEAHYLLRRWTPLNPVDALELLDAKFADPLARAKAVEWVDEMSDEELEPFLLQLVQVLKNEPYHDSPLAAMLMKRALRSPTTIGHSFFWHLKSELHNAYIRERYGLMMQEYLKGLGSHRRAHIANETKVLRDFVNMANSVAKLPAAEGKEILRKKLRETKFPVRFTLPISSTFESSGLIVEKCRVMDSKKRPLWLTFKKSVGGEGERESGCEKEEKEEEAKEEGKEGGKEEEKTVDMKIENENDNQMFLFKVGDDIRQDQLTLQVFRVMELLWLREGLDMRLNVYRAQSTGDYEGFIQVVKNSETIAHITSAAGGATAAFSSTCLTEWLMGQAEKNTKMYEAFQENFAYSCAGYCVATYVLGIGDRHSDNIMITKDGRLFHIDFGHFLGHFKKKLGVEREKAPFIFTPAFAAVLGNRTDKAYVLFVDLAKKAYNVLRKHANLLINLFTMMLSTGIPELKEEKDVQYIQKQLSLNKTDEEAGNSKWEGCAKVKLKVQFEGSDSFYSELFSAFDLTWRLYFLRLDNSWGIYIDCKSCHDLSYLDAENTHFYYKIVIHKNNAAEPEILSGHHRFTTKFYDIGRNKVLDSKDFLPKSSCLVDGKLLVDVWLNPFEYYGNAGNVRAKTGMIGLANQGATCYLNSLLQTLYHTSLFRWVVYHIPFDPNRAVDSQADEAQKSKPKIAQTLQNLFYNLQVSKRSVSTKELTQAFGWNSYEAFEQHDVNELNRILLDRLIEKTQHTPFHDSINYLLRGDAVTIIECIDVDYVSVRTQPFLDLSLSVKGFPSLEASLENYTQPEILDGSNKYNAEKHGMQRASKRTLFLSLPPVLHVQLNRWEYNPMTDRMAKVNDRFEFPVELNMSPFVFKDAAHSEDEEDGGDLDGDDDEERNDNVEKNSQEQGESRRRKSRRKASQIWKMINEDKEKQKAEREKWEREQKDKEKQKEKEKRRLNSDGEMDEEEKDAYDADEDDGISKDNENEQTEDEDEDDDDDDDDANPQLSPEMIEKFQFALNPIEFWGKRKKSNEVKKKSNEQCKKTGKNEHFLLWNPIVEETEIPPLITSPQSDVASESEFPISPTSPPLSPPSFSSQPPSTQPSSTQPAVPFSDSDNVYVLHSVLVHSGGMTGGHYYAYIQPKCDGKWFCFDDEWVRETTEEEAVEDNYGGTEYVANHKYSNFLLHSESDVQKVTKIASAYMLVYVKKSLIDVVLQDVKEDDIPQHIRDSIVAVTQRKKMLSFRVFTDDTLIKGSACGTGKTLFDVQSSTARMLITKRDDTLSDLHTEIEKQTGIPVEEQRVWRMKEVSVDGEGRSKSVSNSIRVSQLDRDDVTTIDNEQWGKNTTLRLAEKFEGRDMIRIRNSIKEKAEAKKKPKKHKMSIHKHLDLSDEEEEEEEEEEDDDDEILKLLKNEEMAVSQQSSLLSSYEEKEGKASKKNKEEEIVYPPSDLNPVLNEIFGLIIQSIYVERISDEQLEMERKLLEDSTSNSSSSISRHPSLSSSAPTLQNSKQSELLKKEPSTTSLLSEENVSVVSKKFEQNKMPNQNKLSQANELPLIKKEINSINLHTQKSKDNSKGALFSPLGALPQPLLNRIMKVTDPLIQQSSPTQFHLSGTNKSNEEEKSTKEKDISQNQVNSKRNDQFEITKTSEAQPKRLQSLSGDSETTSTSLSQRSVPPPPLRIPSSPHLSIRPPLSPLSPRLHFSSRLSPPPVPFNPSAILSSRNPSFVYLFVRLFDITSKKNYYIGRIYLTSRKMQFSAALPQLRMLVRQKKLRDAQAKFIQRQERKKKDGVLSPRASVVSPPPFSPSPSLSLGTLSFSPSSLSPSPLSPTPTPAIFSPEPSDTPSDFLSEDSFLLFRFFQGIGTPLSLNSNCEKAYLETGCEVLVQIAPTEAEKAKSVEIRSKNGGINGSDVTTADGWMSYLNHKIELKLYNLINIQLPFKTIQIDERYEVADLFAAASRVLNHPVTHLMLFLPNSNSMSASAKGPVKLKLPELPIYPQQHQPELISYSSAKTIKDVVMKQFDVEVTLFSGWPLTRTRKVKLVVPILYQLLSPRSNLQLMTPSPVASTPSNSERDQKAQSKDTFSMNSAESKGKNEIMHKSPTHLFPMHQLERSRSADAEERFEEVPIDVFNPNNLCIIRCVVYVERKKETTIREVVAELKKNLVFGEEESNTPEEKQYAEERRRMIEDRCEYIIAILKKEEAEKFEELANLIKEKKEHVRQLMRKLKKAEENSTYVIDVESSDENASDCRVTLHRNDSMSDAPCEERLQNELENQKQQAEREAYLNRLQQRATREQLYLKQLERSLKGVYCVNNVLWRRLSITPQACPLNITITSTTSRDHIPVIASYEASYRILFEQDTFARANILRASTSDSHLLSYISSSRPDPKINPSIVSIPVIPIRNFSASAYMVSLKNCIRAIPFRQFFINVQKTASYKELTRAIFEYFETFFLAYRFVNTPKEEDDVSLREQYLSRMKDLSNISFLSSVTADYRVVSLSESEQFGAIFSHTKALVVAGQWKGKMCFENHLREYVQKDFQRLLIEHPLFKSQRESDKSLKNSKESVGRHVERGLKIAYE